MTLWHHEWLVTFLSNFMRLDRFITEDDRLLSLIFITELILMILKQLEDLFKRIQAMAQTGLVDFASWQDWQL